MWRWIVTYCVAGLEKTWTLMIGTTSQEKALRSLEHKGTLSMNGDTVAYGDIISLVRAQ